MEGADELVLLALSSFLSDLSSLYERERRAWNLISPYHCFARILSLRLWVSVKRKITLVKPLPYYII